MKRLKIILILCLFASVSFGQIVKYGDAALGFSGGIVSYYAPASYLDSLVLYYSVYEMTGGDGAVDSLPDFSNTDNYALQANASYQPIASNLGAYNGELTFDGDDYMLTENNNKLEFGTGDFAITVKFKTGSNIISTERIVSKGSSGIPGWSLMIKNSKVAVAINADGGTNQTAYFSAVEINTTYTVTINLDRDKYMYEYISGTINDSVAYASGNDLSVSNLVYPVNTGRYSGGSQYLTGEIMAILIHNRILTDKEITDIYNLLNELPVAFFVDGNLNCEGILTKETIIPCD